MSARDPNDWMWERAAELLERTAWVQRRFFQVAGERGSAWEPPADVFESEQELLVLIALPGVAAEDVDVRCEPGMLLVSARRGLPVACEGAEVRRLEIPQGRFHRRLPLAGTGFELGGHALDNGLLLVRLRKIG
ncbi:MAG: Hsp20/alpha crystallin family protein [Planctomycetes bacterium]|nr:Hsp20/alpha crystallin family protein [Planctomycetota bacterium]